MKKLFYFGEKAQFLITNLFFLKILQVSFVDIYIYIFVDVMLLFLNDRYLIN